ncbi:hypothetical protein [Rhizobium sp. AN80A]|uniref:DUF6950 family protein n=1 Tax=Rhizobium sp. AN80A TaxID=3040673 RepID=UPI0024B36CB1|nr:hypothetical protein [Rhizobium sp. AN80A]
MISLSEFIDWHGSQPWQPGTLDCCLCLADWAVAIGHPDPATHLRGRYDDEAGFRAIIAEAGGVVPVVASCIVKIAGKPLQQPYLGSIGVIGSPSNIERQWGAVFDGSRWLIRAQAGFMPLVAPTLAIWSI